MRCIHRILIRTVVALRYVTFGLASENSAVQHSSEFNTRLCVCARIKKGNLYIAHKHKRMYRMGMQKELATFGAGCFWSVEEMFRTIPGVIETKVGYMGGAMENPTYEDVCTDETSHAEVLQITFDPEKISYDKLLDIFWECHNPTTRNVQGPNVGFHYRSVIFAHSAEQKSKAENSRSALEKGKKFVRPIVTDIALATTFYPAEEYHQKFLMKWGMKSCHL